MIQLNKTNFHLVKSKFQLKKPWDSFVIFFLSILITIPLFIVLHQNLIDPHWYFGFDRILLFIFVFAVSLWRFICIANHNYNLFSTLFIDAHLWKFVWEF